MIFFNFLSRPLVAPSFYTKKIVSLNAVYSLQDWTLLSCHLFLALSFKDGSFSFSNLSLNAKSVRLGTILVSVLCILDLMYAFHFVWEQCYCREFWPWADQSHYWLLHHLFAHGVSKRPLTIFLMCFQATNYTGPTLTGPSPSLLWHFSFPLQRSAMTFKQCCSFPITSIFGDQIWFLTLGSIHESCHDILAAF